MIKILNTILNNALEFILIISSAILILSGNLIMCNILSIKNEEMQLYLFIGSLICMLSGFVILITLLYAKNNKLTSNTEEKFELKEYLINIFIGMFLGIGYTLIFNTKYIDITIFINILVFFVIAIIMCFILSKLKLNRIGKIISIIFATSIYPTLIFSGEENIYIKIFGAMIFTIITAFFMAKTKLVN